VVRQAVPLFAWGHCHLELPPIHRACAMTPAMYIVIASLPSCVDLGIQLIQNTIEIYVRNFLHSKFILGTRISIIVMILLVDVPNIIATAVFVNMRSSSSSLGLRSKMSFGLEYKEPPRERLRLLRLGVDVDTRPSDSFW